MMKLVIFDMDGLMFDTEAVGFRAYEAVGKEWGLDTDFDFYAALIGRNQQDTVEAYREHYGQDMDGEKLYKAVGDKISSITQTEGLPMKPGLLPLLDAIEAKGFRKVIASSSNEETVRSFLKQAEIEDRFDAIISSKSVKRGKPFPDIFLAACDKMGVTASEALVLEDSPAGILAAVSGGIPVIAIPDLRPITQDIRKKCVFVGRSLLDVIPYIRIK